MTNEPVVVYLGLGSNLGSREDNLRTALSFLSERLRIEKTSSIYETEPIGDINQPRFLNMACQTSTRLSPQALLFLAKGIEVKLGRVGSNGARPIDIDILLYGEQVIKDPDLVIPHPRLAEREFVLVPLVEIAPDVIHPILKKSVRTLLKAVSGKQGVLLWKTS